MAALQSVPTAARGRLARGVAAPLVAARRAARDPAMLRVQVAWAAEMTATWTTTVSLTVVAYASVAARQSRSRCSCGPASPQRSAPQSARSSTGRSERAA